MKYVYACCCLFLLSAAASAQSYDPHWDATDFDPGPYKLNSVVVKDLRADTAAAGPDDNDSDPALSGAIAQFYKGLSTTEGQPADLLILLHHFYIHDGERSYMGGKKDYLRFKADYLLGSQEKDNFRLLGQVDTLVTVKGSRSQAKVLQRLYRDMTPADSPALTRMQAIQMSRAAKQKWPAFKETRRGNAVYTTWQDFLQLQAKAERTIIREGIDYKIEYVNSRGKRSVAPVSYCKVFCYKDNLFLVTESGNLPMQRKGSDFYVSSSKDLMAAGVSVIPYGNGVGVMIPLNRHREAVYEYKVDVRSGQLIPMQ